MRGAGSAPAWGYPRLGRDGTAHPVGRCQGWLRRCFICRAGPKGQAEDQQGPGWWAMGHRGQSHGGRRAQVFQMAALNDHPVSGVKTIRAFAMLGILLARCVVGSLR